MDQNVMRAFGANEPVGASDSANDGTLAAEAEQSFHRNVISAWLNRSGMLDVDKPLVIAARR